MIIQHKKVGNVDRVDMIDMIDKSDTTYIYDEIGRNDEDTIIYANTG